MTTTAHKPETNIKPTGSPIKVRPTTSTLCSFIAGHDAAGRKVHCPKKPTMSLNGKPLCDQHAEIAMVEACGRNVTINREYP